MTKGIKIDRESYSHVVPEFVIWMDQTYPRLSGTLRINVVNDNATFSYRPNDGIKLSDMDKALIRRKWESCVRRAKQQVKERSEESIRDYNEQIAIERIREGNYGAAINALVNLMEEQIRDAEIKEEF